MNPEEAETRKSDKADDFNANELASRIRGERRLLCCADEFYEYDAGCYRRRDERIVRQWIKEKLGRGFSIHRARETIHSLATDCFIETEKMNSNGHLLNVKNGLLDLRTLNLLPHNPDYPCSIQLPVSYVKDASRTLWEKTIVEIMDGNQQKIQTLQEFGGLSLSRDTSQEKALFCVGDGANGKGVFAITLQKILGSENFSAIQLEQFSNKHYLPEFFGRLVNIATESSVNSADFESAFKTVTSGEEIQGDRKFKQPVKFKPFCKLIFLLNDLPYVNDKSNAFFRRLLIVRFEKTFGEEDQDRQLKEKLEAELDGIFAWFLEGLKRLEARGRFEINPDMRAEIEDYRKEQNTAAVFVEEECRLEFFETISKKQLYEAYRAWCGGNGYKPLGILRFGKEVRRNFKTVEEGRNAHEKFWVNIALNAQAPVSADKEGGYDQ